MNDIRELALEAIEEMENMRQNPIIFEFVEKEARLKVIDEIRVRSGLDVSLEEMPAIEESAPNIKNRVESYIRAGLLGCYMLRYKEVFLDGSAKYSLV